MAPHVDMKHWVPYSELAGTKRLTYDEFRQNLLKFPRSGVLIRCARMSAIFDFGPEANTIASEQATERWIPHLFPPQFVPRVQAFAKQGRVIFFQGQLRYLAAEVMRLPKSDTEDDTYFPDMLLGPLLFCAAELLYAPKPQVADELDVMLSLIAMFLPVYEIDSLTEPYMLFIRFYIFLTICIPRLPDHLRTFDPYQEFEKAFHFPLKRYYLLVFAFMMHGMMQRDKNLRGDSLGETLTRSWFKHSNLTDEQLTQMFDAVSFGLSDLPDTKKSKGFADFEFLRDKPYFQHKGELYCLDYEYAVAKLESGVIWRVRNEMSDAQRLPYFSFWGHVFEEYVGWLFEQYAEKKLNVFYGAPKKPDGTELCDAIVVCGSEAVLIEIKMATCSAAVRYSGDHAQFEQFLERDLVGTEKKRKGVSQLQNAIRSITEKGAALPECLAGVNKLIPLIITRDDIGSSWMTNGYLNARFQRGLNRKACRPFTVTPLVSMSVGTLERGLAALAQRSLADILQQRIRGDEYMARPFEAASHYISRYTRHTKKHLDLMDGLIKDMTEEFDMPDQQPSA